MEMGFCCRSPLVLLPSLSLRYPKASLLQRQGTGDGKPSLLFLSGKQLSIETGLASALGREFQIQLFTCTCYKYQIDALQHVLKEQHIIILNATSQQSSFPPEVGTASVWTPE